MKKNNDATKEATPTILLAPDSDKQSLLTLNLIIPNFFTNLDLRLLGLSYFLRMILSLTDFNSLGGMSKLSSLSFYFDISKCKVELLLCRRE